MLDTLNAIFDRLEPLLLVGFGAVLQPLISSWNEHRKRKHELEDRLRVERRQEADNRRKVLGMIIDQQDQHYNAVLEKASVPTMAEPRKEFQALRAMAIAFGDQEILAVVERGPEAVASNGKELRKLIARKIQEMDEKLAG